MEQKWSESANCIPYGCSLTLFETKQIKSSPKLLNRALCEASTTLNKSNVVEMLDVKLTDQTSSCLATYQVDSFLIMYLVKNIPILNHRITLTIFW